MNQVATTAVQTNPIGIDAIVACVRLRLRVNAEQCGDGEPSLRARVCGVEDGRMVDAIIRTLLSVDWHGSIGIRGRLGILLIGNVR